MLGISCLKTGLPWSIIIKNVADELDNVSVPEVQVLLVHVLERAQYVKAAVLWKVDNDAIVNLHSLLHLTFEALVGFRFLRES